jgi:hypothetical protein
MSKFFKRLTLISPEQDKQIEVLISEQDFEN